MLKLIVCSLLIIALNKTSAQENSVGIFLTIKPYKKNNCQKTITARDKKINVCVPSKPIIPLEYFSGITEIRNDIDKNNSSFNVILSKAGFDKLKDLSNTLPQAEFVLVVDNTAVGFLKNIHQLRNKSISIDGPANSADVVWVYESFRKVIPSKK